MRIVQIPAPKARPKRHIKRTVLLVIAGCLLTGIAINYLRPLPPPTVRLNIPKLPIAASPWVAWPDVGQAAVGAASYGVLASSGPQLPQATASIAKVVLSLCVLQKYPLEVGQAGPSFTIGDADVAFYNGAVSQDGSRLPVTLGEQLTEYQALQALLLPSANNIAESLALWVFGSQSAYAAYANQYLQQNGLTQTHIGNDASGYDPSTTSTATDLTRLGLLAAQNATIMEIASQSHADLPVAGTVYNYDTLLGTQGVTGLKTGNNNADPGAFLFTANVPVGSSSVAVSGAVMGAPSLNQALTSSKTIIASLGGAFEQVPIARRQQVVGQMQTAWGSNTPILTSSRLQLIRWKGRALREHHTLNETDVTKQVDIGSLYVTSGTNRTSTVLQLKRPVYGPSVWWRLTRL